MVRSIAMGTSVIALAVFFDSAQAASQMKPGEWETTVKMTVVGGPQIPPAALEMMKQRGIANPLNGDPVVSQRCVTPDQATLDHPFKNDSNHSDCQVQNYQHSGDTASGHMVCTGDFKGEGDFKMTLDSDTRYHGGWNIKGVSRQGTPMEQNIDMSGKWLQDSCTGAAK